MSAGFGTPVLSEEQRLGAREQAAFVAHAPTLQEQEALHTDDFPPTSRGVYPVTLHEVWGQVELQARMLETLAKRLHALEAKSRAIGPHTPIGPGLAPKHRPETPGDALWLAAVGDALNAGVNT